MFLAILRNNSAQSMYICESTDMCLMLKNILYVFDDNSRG